MGGDPVTPAGLSLTAGDLARITEIAPPTVVSVGA